MADLVNTPAWVYNAAPAWPATAKQGDLAFLVAVRIGWHSHADLPSREWTRLDYWQVQPGAVSKRYVDVFSVTVGATPPKMPTEPARWMLVVFTNTQGIGRVRRGVAAVPASANGGVFAFGWLGGAHTDLSGLSLFPVESNYLQGGWAQAGSDGVVGAGGWFYRRLSAWELLPPRGPLPPVVLAPGDGDELSSSEPLVFAWQHRPSISGGTQDAYQWRHSGYRYWNASTGSFSDSAVTNVSSVEDVTVPTSLWQSNAAYGWEVRTREAVDGRWSPWSRQASFMLVTPPSVEVTGPGNTHNDLSPVVTWNSTTPRGKQTAFDVRLVQTAGTVWESKVQPGDATSFPIPSDVHWINGGTYQAQVRVQQTGGSWSPWFARGFSLSWTPPAVPEVRAWPSKQGVLVEVAATTGLDVTLERVTQQGVWVPVGDFEQVDDVVTVSDVLAPHGVTTAYRARAALVLDGMPMVSDWGLSSPVTSTDTRSYIAAAGDPLTTWRRLLIGDDGAHTHERPVSVAYGLGDDRPRVAYGRLRGRTGTVTIHALTLDETAGMVDLLHAGEPLVLRWPAEVKDQAQGFVDGGVLVFDVAGEVDVARLNESVHQRRGVSVGWVEQDAVIGGGRVGVGVPVTDPIGDN